MALPRRYPIQVLTRPNLASVMKSDITTEGTAVLPTDTHKIKITDIRDWGWGRAFPVMLANEVPALAQAAGTS